MKKIFELINKNKFLILIIIFLVLKIIIVEVQPIYIQPTLKYDDALMVDLANNILEGKWLGEFNRFTLIKGIFTPLFLVITNILQIPFLIGKEIFYGFACVFFINVIKKIIPNKIFLFILYICILFNPIESSNQLCQVYREGLYMSLTLFLIASLIGIFLNRKEKISKLIKYYIAFGLSFSSMYICREETVWIMPVVVGAIITTILFYIFDKNIKNKIKRILLNLIPIVIFMIITLTICFINYKYYGAFQINQYWGEEFKEAYGALLRITPEKEIKRVPITKDAIKKAYEVSPKFSELKEFFEGRKGKGWSNCGEHIRNEINGGYIHWALMEAVEEQGYYSSAATANEYYKQLAKEINDACDNNLINSKSEKIISNTYKYNYKDILYTFSKMNEAIKFQYSMKNSIVEVKQTYTFERNYTEEIIKFEKITRSPINKEKYNGFYNSIRLDILKNINNIYIAVNPYLFYISIIVCLGFIIVFIKNIKILYEEFFILIGLACLYISRIFIVTFTKEFMFIEALNIRYLSSIYNIQILFGILSILFLYYSVKKVKKVKKEKMKNQIKENNDVEEIKENKQIEKSINNSDKKLEFTILIPALNEEKTIAIVINKAKEFLNNNNIKGEILISNNGSIDNTKQISLGLGARVIDVQTKGYGAALIEGINQAYGKYIIMGDADDSYNFLELEDFVSELRKGKELVIGNRFGKNMEKGAMQFSHKYIGTPIISLLLSKKNHTKIKDVNCGLRGFEKEKILKLQCKSTEMEFASEMIIKAAKANLKISEVPINFYKDKRETKSHLRTFKDGIRHLKIILKKN